MAAGQARGCATEPAVQRSRPVPVATPWNGARLPRIRPQPASASCNRTGRERPAPVVLAPGFGSCCAGGRSCPAACPGCVGSAVARAAKSGGTGWTGRRRLVRPSSLRRRPDPEARPARRGIGRARRGAARGGARRATGSARAPALPSGPSAAAGQASGRCAGTPRGAAPPWPRCRHGACRAGSRVGLAWLCVGAGSARGRGLGSVQRRIDRPRSAPGAGLCPAAPSPMADPGRPRAAGVGIVETPTQGRRALPAHLPDRQPHLLAAAAEAGGRRHRDAGGLPLEPRADHGAVADQADDAPPGGDARAPAPSRCRRCPQAAGPGARDEALAPRPRPDRGEGGPKGSPAPVRNRPRRWRGPLPAAAARSGRTRRPGQSRRARCVRGSPQTRPRTPVASDGGSDDRARHGRGPSAAGQARGSDGLNPSRTATRGRTGRLRDFPGSLPGDPGRKGGRAVDCTGLENRRCENIRGFESHSFR